MLKHKILEVLKSSLETDKFTLLTPKDASHGDFAVYFPTPGVNLEKLEKNALFEKIEQKGNFINFFISKKFLADELKEILEKKEEYGKVNQDKKIRVYFEFGQPNTHKLPHIGHLFSYIYGESCCRLLEATGQTVFRCNYQGDIGLHVAKCLYRLLKTPGVEEQSGKTPGVNLQEKVEFLQKCYQEGSRLYEEDEKAKKEINELNVAIYKKDSEVIDLWEKTRQWSLDYYKDFEKRLGVKYDKYYFESGVADDGLALVKQNLNKIFEESEGAIIFPGKKYDLHNRVFINKFGNPTYEAKDLGLAQKKYQDWPFDLCIITTANEQNEYWRVVKKAIELALPKLEKKILHIGYGMINLKAGKMSSRTGEIVSAVDLVQTVKSEVEKIKKDSADTVGLSAIKYSFLKSEAKKNIAFNIDESISITGNSGPYLLYSFARCQSVIANEVKQSRQIASSQAPRNDNMNKEELSLLRSFFRFPEVIEEAAKTYSPHLICTYLYDLAQKFNLFYEKCPILKADAQTRNFRLQLTAATAQILKNGLYLLGINVLDRI